MVTCIGPVKWFLHADVGVPLANYKSILTGIILTIPVTRQKGLQINSGPMLTLVVVLTSVAFIVFPCALPKRLPPPEKSYSGELLAAAGPL